MAYHPQTNGQSERFNNTIITRLRQRIAEHPRDWDLYGQWLTYAYNSQVSCSTNVLPFSLVLSWQSPDLSTFDNPTVLPSDAKANTYLHILAARLLYLLSTIRPNASKQVKTAVCRYEGDHDRRTRIAPKTIEIRQNVYLDRPLMTTAGTERLTTQSYSKLLWV